MTMFILGLLIGILATFLFHVYASKRLRRLYMEAQGLNQMFYEAGEQ